VHHQRDKLGRDRKLFRPNKIVRVGGSNPVYRLCCFFAFWGKEKGIFGHAREIVRLNIMTDTGLAETNSVQNGYSET
jgi:hypothetical protein